MKLLFNRKENYLLFTGAGIFSCTLLVKLYMVLYDKNDALSSHDNVLLSLNPIFVFILGVFVAPIIEETVFRGVFTEFKKIKYLFFIIVPLYIIFFKLYIVFVLYFIFVLIFCSKYKYKKKILYFISSLIFSVLHYKISDFENLSISFLFLFQFSLALVLLWILVNFGIKIAILCHGIINFCALLPFLLLMLFPDKQNHKYEASDYTVIWNYDVPFGDKSFQYYEGKSNVRFKNVNVKDIFVFYHINTDEYVINTDVQYQKINFKICRNDSTAIKIEKKTAEDLLCKSKLIYKKMR